MQGFIQKRYLGTNSLLVISLIVFLAMQVLRPGQATTTTTIYEFGGLYGISLQNDWSQLWRLVSPIFVHIGWEHFFFNMMSLYILGYRAEEILGTWKFLLLYLLSGIMGNVFVLFFTPDVVSAGASTSLFGLFGVMAILRYYARNPYLQAMGQQFIGLLAINLIISLVTPSISLAGHIGGLVGGLLCTIFIPIRSEKRLFSSLQRNMAFLVFLLLLIGMTFYRLTHYITYY